MAKPLVEQIEDANRSYLAGNPSFLTEEGPPFVVVYCFDPRLTGLLEPALGLPRHRAMTIRVAGNRVSAENRDVLRSVAAAVYMRGAVEVIVVGHTDCAMASFQASEVMDSFRRSNVPREAFGDADLRRWFGAIGSVRGNVAESVEFIRKCGVFPTGLPVYGFVIDTATGKLESVSVEEGAGHRPAPVTARPEAPREEPPSIQQAPPPPPPPPLPRPVVIDPGPEPLPKSLPVPDSLLGAARLFSAALKRARGNRAFQHDLLELKAVMRTERNPLRILAAIEALARKYAVQYPELPALASYLRAAMSHRSPGQADPLDAIRRVLG